MITIYHNPACGTSRKVLEAIRAAGFEPTIVEYLRTPLSRNELRQLVEELAIPLRAVIRERGTPYHELGLDNPALSDDALFEAMAANPILLERPIVITGRGARLCRPAEEIQELLAALA